MKRDYNFYIKDIMQSIILIEEFVEGMDYEEFLHDEKTTSAVIRKLEIIGEAAKHIPARVRQAHSKLPWNEMARMRDKLIHGYFGVDHDRGRIPQAPPSRREVGVRSHVWFFPCREAPALRAGSFKLSGRLLKNVCQK